MRSYGTRNGYSSHCRGQCRELSSSKSNAQHLKRCLPHADVEVPLKTLLSVDWITENVEKCADVASR
jgi:hypothetical protein